MAQVNLRDSVVIHRLSGSAPVRFAADELARYLEEMTGAATAVRPARRYDEKLGGLWVGVADRFGRALHQDLPAGDLFHDAILVRVRGDRGILAGANPRSVVFAVYRYLEELGCRWFRPGADGEWVPGLRKLPSRRIVLDEQPSARHRCICIEGSCSTEHVRDMIDYAARRGFNSYFLQFRNAYTFFERWYAHERPQGRHAFTEAGADRAWRSAKREAHRRGLLLHTVGHGWTCEPFGIPGLEWAPLEQAVPAKTRQYFAEVSGERALWGGVPLNTNLCYSDPHVQKTMAGAVTDYAEAHPDEAVVHVWLADGSNNQCECASCQPARPSDFYVQILNQIDAELSSKGLSTRIVLLAYVDLLWAPQRERIANPDRFILMFAPITRSYSAPLVQGSAKPPRRLAPYRRNRLRFPDDPAENLRLLKGWERCFRGEVVDFDYHLMFDPENDPSGMEIVPILHRDLHDLAALGMDGFITCQRTRVAFPTGLALHVIGRTLWDREQPYEEMVDQYFLDLFGPDGLAVRDYLVKLGRLFDSPFLRGEKPDGERSARRKWAQVAAHTEAFSARIEKGRCIRLGFRAAAWELLGEHACYVRLCAELFGQLYRDDPRVVGTYKQLQTEFRRRLPRLHHVLDTFYALRMLGRKLEARGFEVGESG